MRLYSAIVDGWRCSVKEIDSDLVDPNMLLDYENELSRLKELPFHKNIDKLLVYFRISKLLKVFYTGTENNMNLSQKLELLKKENKSLACEKIVKFCLDLVKGLIFLHENKLIHKDLNSNIFFILFYASIFHDPF